MEPLSDQRVQSYLRHLGGPEPSEPTLDYLDRLIRAHLERVTFENLDVLLERRISLDAEAVLGKETGSGRGGYCYELNSLFARLLLALGYGVRLRAARLRLLTPDDSPKRTPLIHMLLLVEPTNGHRYIVDVGMAQSGLHRALPLEGDATPFLVRSLAATEALEVALPTSDGGWKAVYVVEPVRPRLARLRHVQLVLVDPPGQLDATPPLGGTTIAPGRRLLAAARERPVRTLVADTGSRREASDAGRERHPRDSARRVRAEPERG
ncbi:hypothetical protein HPB49_017682 [Dermacentor silvarum]|uniref:Uncharacterized protein n=1 Tax=Dermacentor silvarum TaxID=543639 RepID=A0ACB8CAJ5_DERSI|nr:hypothetical protein HPB49_017682 [Dermacentor silvarum]